MMCQKRECERVSGPQNFLESKRCSEASEHVEDEDNHPCMISEVQR